MLEYIISILGIITGYLIANYTKEELNKGMLYFKVIEILCLLSIVYLSLSNFNLLLFASGVFAALILKFDYFYIGLSSLNTLDAASRFVHSSLIFVYGLANGSINYGNKKIILVNVALFFVPMLLYFLDFHASSISAGALTVTVLMKGYNLIN